MELTKMKPINYRIEPKTSSENQLNKRPQEMLKTHKGHNSIGFVEEHPKSLVKSEYQIEIEPLEVP